MGIILSHFRLQLLQRKCSILPCCQCSWMDPTQLSNTSLLIDVNVRFVSCNMEIINMKSTLYVVLFLPSNISAPLDQVWDKTQIRLPIVPLGTNKAASLPVNSAILASEEQQFLFLMYPTIYLY